MIPTLLLSIVPTAPLTAPVQEPTSLAAEIVEVTVYSGAASVKRRATAPAGGGTFVVPDLPRSVDPETVRVESTGAEVIGVELRDRFKKNVSDERVTELRARVRELERRVQALEDEAYVLAQVDAYLQSLLRREEAAHAAELERGQATVARWEENFAFVRDRMTENRAAVRDVERRLEDARRELQDAKIELGRCESADGVHVYDLVFELADTSGRPASLDIDTIVGSSGWAPVYDLRAPKDLSTVELVYRASVWQRTGEDWSDVDVLLSTAQPRRGAQGPEPTPAWLSLRDPRLQEGKRAAYDGAWKAGRAELEALAYADDAAEEPDLAALAFAEVAEEGVSVRYRLPRKETIESRDQPTTVLIGRADLDVTPEHVVVPKLDTTVWLRARAENSSSWVLLPGRAAVYFGADFLGHSRIGSVQRGEELTLHLGPDPGLVVERTQIRDLTEGSGLFSSKKTRTQEWKIAVANRGAFTPHADGRVAVIVHEVLPRTSDERIEVEIDEVRPPLAKGARWEKEREEKGVLTWVVTVPRGGEQVISLVTEIRWPEDMNLVGR